MIGKIHSGLKPLLMAIATEMKLAPMCSKWSQLHAGLVWYLYNTVTVQPRIYSHKCNNIIV